jgi:hypothetical protein
VSVASTWAAGTTAAIMAEAADAAAVAAPAVDAAVVAARVADAEDLEGSCSAVIGNKSRKGRAAALPFDLREIPGEAVSLCKAISRAC